MRCRDGIAPGSKASEERATKDREEVAEIHRHNSQHAGMKVSDAAAGEAKTEETYSR